MKSMDAEASTPCSVSDSLPVSIGQAPVRSGAKEES
jgi:hypothetical protein